MSIEHDERIAAQLRSDNLLGFEISGELVRNKELGELGMVVAAAVRTGLLHAMAGRVCFQFPDHADAEREIFEIPECKQWLAYAQEEMPYLGVLLHPQLSFPLLMLSFVSYTIDAETGHVEPEHDEAASFIFQAGMMAYALGREQQVDARELAGVFLTGVGFPGSPDQILAAYEALYEQQQEA